MHYRTGGASSFVPDNLGPDYLNNALTNCFQFQPSIQTKEKQEILLQQTNQDISSDLMTTFSIDKFCGRQVSVELDYQNIAGSFTIESTLNESISETIQGPFGSFDFMINSVDPGDYSITVTPVSQGDSIDFLTMLVKCKAEEDTEPILSNCWTSAGQEDFTIEGSDPNRLIIYGQVTQGANPVLDAQIAAKISNDQGDISDLSLKDDGLSPDSIRNDGIYSGYYIPSGFTQAGSRYSLTCKISGTNETSMVNTTDAYVQNTWIKGMPSRPTSTTPMCCGSLGIKVRNITETRVKSF